LAELPMAKAVSGFHRRLPGSSALGLTFEGPMA
jgi:hypothetical protein